MLSPTQIAQLKSSAALGGANPSTVVTTGMTDEQYNAWKTGSMQSPSPTATAPTAADYGSAVASGVGGNPLPALKLGATAIKNAPADTIAAAKGGVEQAKEGIDQIMNGGGPAGGVVAGVEGGLKVESGLASIVSSPLAAAFKPLGLGINEIAQIVSESPTLQKFAQSTAGQNTARVAEDVSNAGNVAGTITGVDQAVKAVPGAIEGVKSAADALTPTPKEAAPTPSGPPPMDAKSSRIINQRVSELNKLESSNAVVRKAIAGAADKGIDVKDIVANTDLLQGAVDKDGTIRTTQDGGAVEQLNDFIKPQEDVISQTLKREGKTIPLSDLEDKLMKAVNDSSVKGGAKIRALANAKADIAGYKLDAVDANGQPWVEGQSEGEPHIPLSTVHDAKVDKYSNIDYTNPESAKTDKVIAKTLKQVVEDNTDSVDVKALNAELSKHYATLNFLEKLDGKKVAGGRLGKYFAQTVGAIVGSHFGPLGGIAGAEAGGLIKGAQMAGKFGEPIGASLEQSDAMKSAIAANQSSKSTGSLNTAQSTNNTNLSSATTPESVAPMNVVGTPQGVDSAANIVDRHLNEAEQVVKNIEPSHMEALGGMKELMKNTITNMSDGLKAEGHDMEAKMIKGLDAQHFTSVEQLRKVVTSVLDILKEVPREMAPASIVEPVNKKP